MSHCWRTWPFPCPFLFFCDLSWWVVCNVLTFFLCGGLFLHNSELTRFLFRKLGSLWMQPFGGQEGNNSQEINYILLSHFGFVIFPTLSHSHKLSKSTESTPSTSLRNCFLLAGKMYFPHECVSFTLHRIYVDFMAHILNNLTSHSNNLGFGVKWQKLDIFSKGVADAQLSAHNQCI